MQNQKYTLESLADVIKEKLSDWEPSANMIEMIVGNPRDERSYSNILAWLMNPKSAHGFGKTFLQKFLGHAKEEAETDGKPFCRKWENSQWSKAGAGELSNELEIKREDYTRNRKFIDIVCEDTTNNFVLCIENKVLSNENPAKSSEEPSRTQLQQYTEHLEKNYGSEYSVVAIYLKQLGKGKGENVPDACKKEESPWHHVSYVAVVQAITDILGDYKPGKEASECMNPQSVGKYVAYQFRDLIIRVLMKPEDDDLPDKYGEIARRKDLINLCNEIYRAYRAYFEYRDYTAQLVEKYNFNYSPKIGGGLRRSNGFMRGGGANFQPEKSIFKSLLGENGQWAYQLEIVKEQKLSLKLTIVEARAQAEHVQYIANVLLVNRESKTVDAPVGRFAPRLRKGRNPLELEEIETWNDFVVWKSSVQLTKDGNDFEKLMEQAAAAEKYLEKYLIRDEETETFCKNDINDSERKFDERLDGGKWKLFREKHEFFIKLIEDFNSVQTGL